MDEDREEKDTPREVDMEDSTQEEPITDVQNEMVESDRPVYPPIEYEVNGKRLSWIQNIL
jgi:hypothetical protein